VEKASEELLEQQNDAESAKKKKSWSTSRASRYARRSNYDEEEDEYDSEDELDREEYDELSSDEDDDGGYSYVKASDPPMYAGKKRKGGFVSFLNPFSKKKKSASNSKKSKKPKAKLDRVPSIEDLTTLHKKDNLWVESSSGS